MVKVCFNSPHLYCLTPLSQRQCDKEGHGSDHRPTTPTCGLTPQVREWTPYEPGGRKEETHSNKHQTLTTRDFPVVGITAEGYSTEYYDRLHTRQIVLSLLKVHHMTVGENVVNVWSLFSRNINWRQKRDETNLICFPHAPTSVCWRWRGRVYGGGFVTHVERHQRRLLRGLTSTPHGARKA
jgi:hypothetical protein